LAASSSTSLGAVFMPPEYRTPERPFNTCDIYDTLRSAFFNLQRPGI
jgi:hypothetical protein